MDPGSGLARDRVVFDWELYWCSTCVWRVSGALLTIREKQGERLVRYLAVPITAAGPQGLEPLVRAVMWVREVGKMGP